MKSIMVKGKPASDDASRVCVLYDPKDGRVVHVHGVTVLEGGKDVSHPELEQRAMAHARNLGRSVEGLKPLHLPASAVRQHGNWKVNAEGSALVPSPDPQPVTQRLAEHRKATANKRG